MPRRMWVFDPRSGGQKIPPLLQDEIRQRILKHAAKIVPEKASQVRVRFRGHCCYIDAEEPDTPVPTHLCRLRYMGSFREPKAWAMDFYTYSHEKYEPSVFMSGEWLGTPKKLWRPAPPFCSEGLRPEIRRTGDRRSLPLSSRAKSAPVLTCPRKRGPLSQ